MSDDQGSTDAPEPRPDPDAETGDEVPTRDREAPGVGALDEGDDVDADPPEPNEPA